MQRKFLRVDTFRFSRLGKNRRKLQKWRSVRGKSNKMRLGRAGYSKVPTVGFKSPRKDSGKVGGLIPRLVHNVKELEALQKDNIAVLARIGAKKKLEMIKRAGELNIKIMNLNNRSKK